MQASAGFVSASALGMACGPALAGLLQWKFKIYMVTFNQSTLPGWVMAVAWLLYLVWLSISFKEPNRATEVNDATQNPASGKFKKIYCSDGFSYFGLCTVTNDASGYSMVFFGSACLVHFSP